MNDEAQPGHFSVETAEYLEESGFGAEETGYSEESEFVEADDLPAEPGVFPAPATGFSPARDFSLFPPESGSSAESGSWSESAEETTLPEETGFSFAGETAFSWQSAERPAETAEVPVHAVTEAVAESPAETVEAPDEKAAQLPVRTTGELSVLRTPELPAGMDPRLPEDLWAYESYPVVESAPIAREEGGVVSLGYLGAAIKRRKKVWALTTALGVLVAAALYSTYHASYTDTATVLLSLDPNLDTSTAIQADAILAVDSAMAQQAMQKLGVHDTAPNFLKTYSVTTINNNLLTITAEGATSNAAYNEANTLATTFLRYRAQTELEKESANTAALDQQVTQTQQTISALKKQITKVKAESFPASQQSRLTRLQGDLTSAQNLLASLQQTVASSVATSRSATASLIAGSRVLDTGIPASGVSQKKFAFEYGGAAIFGGLVIGLLIVAIGAIVSDRLRRRDDVAAALGAPVRVSVASGGGNRSRKSGREADLTRVAAHLRGCVPGGSGGAGSLVVVAVDETKFVSEAIKELAISGAHEGKRVVVADLSGGTLGRLFGVKEPGIRGVDAGGTRLVLVTPERGDLAPIGPLQVPGIGAPMDGVAGMHGAADVFITLATVNSASGAAHLKTWGDDAVAVITAGRSPVTRVQAVGEMIRFAGLRLTSAVLLGADEKDESLGFVTV